MYELKSVLSYTLKGNYSVDIKGNNLQSGDKILIYNSFGERIIFSELDKNLNLSSFNHQIMATSGDLYIFKLYDEEYFSAKNLWESIMSKDSIYNFENDCFSNVLKTKEDIYKTVNNKKTARSMEMLEITGKNLKIGDLVIFFKDSNVDYGIVYSHNKVVLKDMTIQNVKVVYKPLFLNDEEKKLQDYIQTSVLKSKNIDAKKIEKLEKGMVFTSKDSMYIYLGKCSINPYYIGVSPYIMEYKIDEADNLYIKLPSTNLKAILDSPDLLYNDIFNRNVWPCVFKERKKVIDNHLEVKYMGIEYVQMFVDKTERNLKYWGKIKLSDSIRVFKNIYFKITYLD